MGLDPHWDPLQPHTHAHTHARTHTHTHTHQYDIHRAEEGEVTRHAHYSFELYSGTSFTTKTISCIINESPLSIPRSLSLLYLTVSLFSISRSLSLSSLSHGLSLSPLYLATTLLFRLSCNY